jgi:alpha-beta hydrolase superfamily lysophospholipase
VKNKKTVLRWLKTGILLYGAAGIAIYYLQDKVLFHPQKLNIDYHWLFTQPFTEKNLPLDSTTVFNMVQFTVPDSARKGVVLYFHGNRENINHYAPFVPYFTRNGYEVWMPDYPGFGKSAGNLTEQVLYEEALQVYKLARAQYQPGQIIIYGKSMGTGIAAQLASIRDCKKLVLETPYYSLVSLVRRVLWMYPLDLMMHFKIPEYEYISKVTAPITLFHGTSDGVIPYGNAVKLKEVLKPGDKFITIEGGSHNDLYSFPLVQKKLDSLLKN